MEGGEEVLTCDAVVELRQIELLVLDLVCGRQHGVAQLLEVGDGDNVVQDEDTIAVQELKCALQVRRGPFAALRDWSVFMNDR